MCGLVFVERLDGKAAAPAVWKRYGRQRSRGADGFGYVAFDRGRLSAYRRDPAEEGIRARLGAERSGSVLFHHRLPTSTPNIAESAHPLKISHPSFGSDYYLAHNGVIGNDAALKAAHEAAGFRYATTLTRALITAETVYNHGIEWNDSEALAIELARAIETGEGQIAAEGTIAFIMLRVARASGAVEAIYWGRNAGSPLCYHAAPGFWSLASEGAGESVPPNRLFSARYERGRAGRVESVPFVFPMPQRVLSFDAPEWFDDEGYCTARVREVEDGLGITARLLREARERGDAAEAERLEGEIEDLRDELEYLREALSETAKERRERSLW